MKVLCLHGLGCHLGYFQDMELPDGYQMLTYDLLGHGNNQSTEKITLENMAHDMWDRVEHLGPIVILGHSLGGLVAQEMYEQQPDRVKSLILANTYSYFAPGVSDLAYFNRWYNFNILSAKDYVEKTIDNCLYDNRNEELRSKARQAFHIRRHTYLDACRAGTYANYRDLLPKIKVPTLIISSANDEVIKPFVQKDMHEKIKGSNLVTLERCGHLSNIEKPLEFSEAIRDFING